MSEWKIARLDEVCSLIKRGIGPQYTEEDSGIPVLNQRCIRDQKVSFENARLNDLKKKKIPVDRYLKNYDVLINSTGVGTLGRVAQIIDIKDKVTVDSHVTIVRLDQENIDPTFFGMALRYRQRIFEELGEGSTGQTELSPKRVGEISIEFPESLPEQKSIAHILGTLDDKIELNRQMNQTLEAMAQALFKSWFVDFDPVMDNALAAGHELPDELQAMAEKRRVIASDAGAKQSVQPGSSKRLIDTNPELAAKFPSSFVFDETLGKWIPQGWEVKSLGDLADCNKNSWSNRNTPAFVDYVDLANTKNGQIDATSTYAFAEAPSRARRILKTGDTIFGTVRPGNRSYAYIDRDGLTGSTGFAVFTPKETANRAFVYIFVTQQEIIELLAHLADGGAYPAINPNVISDLSIVFPGRTLIEQFQKIAGSTLDKISNNKKETETLTELRDRLLPELISGRVRVKELDERTEQKLAMVAEKRAIYNSKS